MPIKQANKGVNAKKTDNKKKKLRKNKGDSDSEDDTSEYETTSDSTYEPPKHKIRTRSNSKLLDNEEDADEEDIEDTEDEEEEEDEYEDEDEEEDEEEDGDDEETDKKDKQTMGRAAIQKIISEIFPSKYMSRRVKQTEQEIENKRNDKKSKPTKKQSSSKKGRGKAREEEYEEEEESSEYEEDDDDYDDEDEEDGTYNILLLDGMDGQGAAEDDYNEENDDAECNSDDEKMFMKETYEQVEVPIITDKKTKTKKTKKSEDTKKKTEDEEDKLPDVEKEYLDMIDTKKSLTAQLKRKPTNKILQKAVRDCDASIKNLIKQSRINNAKAYHKLIHSHKKQTNEVDYFKTKLSNKEQLRVMSDLKEVNSYTNIDKPYRLALLDAKMPAKFKSVAMQKLSVLRSMDPSDNEYYKIKNWVDAFMKIPFGIYRNLSISIDDGLDKCHEYMNNAMTTLNNCVYGLNDAKLQIMQMVGQWISNPSAMGTAIAIKGPMGTGKTTLVKEGISKILGRDFAFIALGGTGDSSFLEGHSYTYEGSTWGKIVQILMNSKCMNPVIYFDELDKISDTPRGEEIVGILTHLTDTSQNSQFHDKYFSEVDFDLSKCLFIFSYNDESRVNPILRDRMYRIQTKGYDAKEKVTIARNYILPKIQEQVNFKEGDIIIPDETLQYIISNAGLTHEEAGVRNLKRCLEIIYTKLNLFRLMKPDTKIIGIDIDLKVSFPFTVTKREVDIIIKNEEKHNQSMLAMYV